MADLLPYLVLITTRMKCFLSCLFIAFCFATFAQTVDSVKIVGQLTGDSLSLKQAVNSRPRLAPYHQGSEYYSTKVGSNETFTVSVAASHPELYELKYAGYKMDVLVCPDERVFNVEIELKKGEVVNMKAVGSRQYDAYRALKRINGNFKDKFHDLVSQLRKNPKHPAGDLSKEIAEFNASLTYLQKAYSGTFAAEKLAPIAMLPEVDKADKPLEKLQQHFFDGADFNDVTIYYAPNLNEKISSYIDFIADTSAPARLALINALYQRTKTKDAQQELLTLLMNLFTDAGREDYLSSLVQWAGDYKKLEEEQPVLNSKIKLLAKTLPGAIASEVSGEDVTGKNESLLAVTKSNPLTLLIFWASDCTHCRKSMPEFLKLYSKYHPKGLEIFAASVEADKDKWKAFVAKNHLEWHNILLPPESPAHSDYDIQFTPTLVLINNQSVILRRFIETGDLDKTIGDILGPVPLQH